ncbi:hypothetical protein GTCCBUS3UF5_11810 [Geobacillus thermoleovorans CCB_US3_UF5]|uniref:Uncharacterized protein n=2 Tax=Geobacillus TaxID=129337 RepID=A0A1Q5T7K2_9BACL|nr:hypothetical protein GTCCBUS3UF5_11810 [Geobacillus thermoleovorans CCB_US3_UF5]OKO96217.1 hypothetical protein BRO54_0396 [Geobacillus proteiniphilus]
MDKFALDPGMKITACRRDFHGKRVAWCSNKTIIYSLSLSDQDHHRKQPLAIFV